MVYLAEQTEPVRRRVALKVIKPGMDTKAVIARFEAERQAAFDEIRRIIREVEPPKPNTKVSSLGIGQETEPGAPATGLSTPRSRSGLGSAVDADFRRPGTSLNATHFFEPENLFELL